MCRDELGVEGASGKSSRSLIRHIEPFQFQAMATRIDPLCQPPQMAAQTRPSKRRCPPCDRSNDFKRSQLALFDEPQANEQTFWYGFVEGLRGLDGFGVISRIENLQHKILPALHAAR
jgi:hypothetical protein